MNTSKLLNICRYIFRYKPQQKIAYIKNIKPPLKNTTKLLLYSTVAGISIKEEEIEIPNENKSIDHESLLTEDFLNIQIKLTDLIKTLQKAVTGTCEKYRNCLEKQMDIMEKGTDLDPSNAYWDQLIELKSEAANLRKEFETYKDMVQHVGQTAFSIALCSTLINTEDADKYICNDFFDLERICNEEIEENKVFEKMLLEVSMRSILKTKI